MASVPLRVQSLYLTIDFHVNRLTGNQCNTGSFLRHNHVQQSVSKVDLKTQALPSYWELTTETGHAISDIKAAKPFNYRQPGTGH